MAPPPVQRQPENDAVHPRPKFLRLAECIKLLIGAQKRLLCDIFRVGGIAQNAVGYLKNAPLILSDPLAKSRFGTMYFGSGNQRTHARPCHANSALSVLTPQPGRSFSNITRLFAAGCDQFQPLTITCPSYSN